MPYRLGMTLLSQQTAAERLKISPARVRQMDAELKPFRIVGKRGLRVYLETEVERVAGARHQKLRSRL
jgi:hypothetical protein